MLAPSKGGRAPLAALVLVSFAMTCLVSRVVVYVMMMTESEDLYVRVGGVHVHHFVWGIGMLAILGLVQVLAPQRRINRRQLAIGYGVAIGLTFDEFGFWLNMGGSYWQRSSFDALALIFILLAAVVVWPYLRRRLPVDPRRVAAVAIIGLGLSAAVLFQSYRLGRRALAAVREHVEPTFASDRVHPPGWDDRLE